MIEEFLKELKSSYHKNEMVYTEGSCFRLHSILKTLFPQAKPLYSILEGHWITEIDSRYYDINGEINADFAQQKEYREVTDTTTLSSAYSSNTSNNVAICSLFISIVLIILFVRCI